MSPIGTLNREIDGLINDVAEELYRTRKGRVRFMALSLRCDPNWADLRLGER